MIYDHAFFASQISALRMAKGVSARDMSLSIGQSPDYINKIESKKNYPSMAMFIYICEYLGVTPKEFFDVSSQPPGRISELISDLYSLEDETLENILGIIQKYYAHRKST
ncbi:MAG: helix-turn-helix domain-containing protein [Defluviitaleaceae bacterium]|nr:helix-turn-helix domain-containing protein [Defluviitaleaceae bacterium]